VSQESSNLILISPWDQVVSVDFNLSHPHPSAPYLDLGDVFHFSQGEYNEPYRISNTFHGGYAPTITTYSFVWEFIWVDLFSSLLFIQPCLVLRCVPGAGGWDLGSSLMRARASSHFHINLKFKVIISRRFLQTPGGASVRTFLDMYVLLFFMDFENSILMMEFNSAPPISGLWYSALCHMFSVILWKNQKIPTQFLLFLNTYRNIW